MAENPGVSLYDGKLWHLEDHGIGNCPGHKNIQLDLNFSKSTIMVNGFRYDPKSKKDNNPHNSTFIHWRDNIIKDPNAFGFGWWSCPGGIGLPSSMWRSYRSGRWNTYRYAWDLAELAGIQLAKIMRRFPRPVTILCHSLGSRVVLSAIARDEMLPISRVVLMNGAELRKTAVRIVKHRPEIKFFNLVVEEDDVLKKFGALFAPGGIYQVCIGQTGLGIEAPDNWKDIELDSAVVKSWAKKQGWPGVQGDNPKGYLDHWWTHKNERNWGLIQALLMQEDLV